MRHLVALIALATVLISTPAFPTWKTSYHTDNLTGLKYPEDIVVQGRLTHDGSPAENHLNFGSIHYDCEDQIFRIILITPHRSIPSSFDVFEEIEAFGGGVWSASITLRGVFDGPNRPVNKVEQFKSSGIVFNSPDSSGWSMKVPSSTDTLGGSNPLFEKTKTGEVTSIKIEFPTESGGLVYQYDTDNFPADACEGK